MIELIQESIECENGTVAFSCIGPPCAAVLCNGPLFPEEEVVFPGKRALVKVIDDKVARPHICGIHVRKTVIYLEVNSDKKGEIHIRAVVKAQCYGLNRPHEFRRIGGLWEVLIGPSAENEKRSASKVTRLTGNPPIKDTVPRIRTS